METEQVEIPVGKMGQAAVTPEEKLFRVISAANRSEADFQELLEKFSIGNHQKKQQALGGKIAQCWNAGMKGLESLGVGLLEPLRQSPKLMSLFILALTAFIFWNLAGKTGSEKTFYFYGMPAPAEKTGDLEAASSVKLPAGAAAPLREEPPYKLVGISRDGENRVAMIETLADGRARFAREGETLSGNVKVAQIKDYSVTLSSGTLQWEIT